MKILVVDDHALVREGLRHVLRGLGDDVDVLQAGTCAHAFEIALSHPDLDLVLLDFHLPDMSGLQALDVFAQQNPELPIIVLSGSINPRIIHQVMKKGAAAFLNKSGLSDELLTVTRKVLAGESGIAPELMLPGANPATEELNLPTVPPLLTPRQADVLLLLLDGYTNKEIGRMLSLSDETVKNHISAILRGFAVQTRTQAVLAANRLGYTRSNGVG